jgi:hypothetical protein
VSPPAPTDPPRGGSPDRSLDPAAAADPILGSAGAEAFARACLPETEAGKTLLVLFAAGRPNLALAAALQSGTDRERFLTLARYLLRRESGDGYWLVAPMRQGDSPCLVIERGTASACRQSLATLCGAGGRSRLGESGAVSPVEPLLGDLFAAGVGLPAILRRQLDHLAAACAIPLPELDAER